MPRKAKEKKTSDKPRNPPPKGRSLGSVPNGLPKTQPKRLKRGSRAIKNSDDELITVGGPSNPIVIKKPSSYASRKRKRITLSMRNVFSDSSKDNATQTDHASQFAPGSTAEYTWGIATSNPVTVLKAKRRHQGFRAFGLRRGRKITFERFMFGKNSDDIEPFRFMDFPLEIRRKVYSYLLVRPRPILLGSEWSKVYITSNYDHTILLVNKQISLESSQVLYENNVFQTYIGFKNGFHSFRMGTIAKRFIPQFRNVIIESRKSDWMLALACDLASCISALIKNDTNLNSLTLVIGPSKATGDPVLPLLVPANMTDQTTFADFFQVPSSNIMRVIPKLQCKILNIVIRLPDNKRALISIDLRANFVNESRGGWLADNAATKWSAKKRLGQLKDDLRDLKKRFEDVCGNPEKAVLKGKARFLGKDENLSNGVHLADLSRKFLSRRPSETVAIPPIAAGQEPVRINSHLVPIRDQVLQFPQVL